MDSGIDGNDGMGDAAIALDSAAFSHHAAALTVIPAQAGIQNPG